MIKNPIKPGQKKPTRREILIRMGDKAVGRFPPFATEAAMQRYNFVLERVNLNGKSVLDVACGPGYGSELLSSKAAKVIGVDLDSENLHNARERYGDVKNLKFAKMDAEHLSIRDNSFDVAVSMEILEHVPHPEKMVAELSRVLKPNGTLVLSTPNKTMGSLFGVPFRPEHLREYSLTELVKILEAHFDEIELCGWGIVSTKIGRAKHRLIATARTLPGAFHLSLLARGKKASRTLSKITGTEEKVEKITNPQKQPRNFVIVCRNRK